MPSRIWTDRCDHAYVCMHTQAQSCLHVYAHIGAIMPSRICTHRRDYAHACMHTYVRSCPRVYAHTGAIMPTRVCSHRCDHAHACIMRVNLNVCEHEQGINCSFVPKRFVYSPFFCMYLQPLLMYLRTYVHLSDAFSHSCMEVDACRLHGQGLC